MKLSSDSINIFASIMLGTTGLSSSLQKSEIDKLLKLADVKIESFEKLFKDFPDIKNIPNIGISILN